MKVKFLIGDDEDANEWRDLYIDEDLVDGFYMPDEIDDLEPCINVLYRGQFMTFLKTTQLVAFLELKFII